MGQFGYNLLQLQFSWNSIKIQSKFYQNPIKIQFSYNSIKIQLKFN